MKAERQGRPLPLQEHPSIDEISDALRDPTVASGMLLRLRYSVVNKRLAFGDALAEVERLSREALKSGSALYFAFKVDERGRVLRGLVLGKYVVALVAEEQRGVVLWGKRAYDETLVEWRASNVIGRLSAGAVAIREMPQPLSSRLGEIASRLAEERPPAAWVGRMLYDFKVLEVLSERGGFVYVLKGADRWGRAFALKVPRDRLQDGSPLAVGNRERLLGVLKAALASLSVCLATAEEIEEGCEAMGVGRGASSELAKYRKYVLCPRAIVVLSDDYTAESYAEAPPLIAEQLADAGDMAQHYKDRRPDARELLAVGIRVSGALALSHALGFVHMDVKPQNVLLTSDEGEPFGLRPMLGDFASERRALEGWIRPKRITPDYADPLSLLEGRAGFDYDVYSLALTLIHVATGRKMPHRTLVNLLALKYLYGAEAPLDQFVVEHPALANARKRLEPAFAALAEGRAKRAELLDEVSGALDEFEKIAKAQVEKDLGTELAGVLLRAASLNKRERHVNGYEIWKELVHLAVGRGWKDLVP